MSNRKYAPLEDALTEVLNSNSGGYVWYVTFNDNAVCFNSSCGGDMFIDFVFEYENPYALLHDISVQAENYNAEDAFKHDFSGEIKFNAEGKPATLEDIPVYYNGKGILLNQLNEILTNNLSEIIAADREVKNNAYSL